MISVYKSKTGKIVYLPEKLVTITLLHGASFAVSRRYLTPSLNQRIAPNIEVPSHPVDMVSKGWLVRG